MINNRQSELTFKIMLRGDRGSGKKTILNRLISDEYIEGYGPGHECIHFDRFFIVDKQLLKAQVWNPERLAGYRGELQYFYTGIHAVFVILDLTDIESYEQIDYYFKEIPRFTQNDIIKILVGNKSDSERIVSFEEVLNKALGLGVIYLEISLKTGDNFSLLLEIACRQFLSMNGFE